MNLNTFNFWVSEGVATPDEGTSLDDGFEVVAQYFSPTDAHVVADCLRVAGIPAFIADANLVQANYLLAIAVGGVRIRVPTQHAVEAREVIAAFERGGYALADDDEVYRS